MFTAMAQVQFLAGELRSTKPHSVAKNFKKERRTIYIPLIKKYVIAKEKKYFIAKKNC